MNSKEPRLLIGGRSALSISAAILTLMLISAPYHHARAAECNSILALALKNARQNGDAFAFATLPNFGSLESSDVQIGGWGREIHFLIKRHTNLGLFNLNVLLATLNQYRDRSVPMREVYGLNKFQGKNATGIVEKDLYFYYDGEIVTDILVCSPPGPGDSGDCEHSIVKGAFSVRVSYGYDWLPEWRDIRNAIMETIDHCDPT